ncbi:MAG: single-stranded-DNA-specific exonuclease RecJ [Spartobacteria bacterium]|nr:single-stranded-DNA-specific exonuclease RecJ [Spartobacteria bacterium]
MKIWQENNCDERLVSALTNALHVHPAISACLVSRGLEDIEEARLFMHPDMSHLSSPRELPDMDVSVERILRAITGHEAIAIYGDYDVDGMTSTALLAGVIGNLGGCIQTFLPDRIDEGYGLSVEGLQRCIEAAHPNLIITVDCGTNSHESVRRATAAGIDVIVTDHHELGEETAPALALVNPKRTNRNDIRMLAGVGVAFKTCQALIAAARKQGLPAAMELDVNKYLDLVALGTICDIVPLMSENRVLAKFGLDCLAETESAGLQALMEVAGIKGRIGSYQVGFQLGPRLNAAGRMGDADSALELLMTQDHKRAGELARKLDAVNRERQQVEAEIIEEAKDLIEQSFDPITDFGVVVSGQGWHPGVIGIVASRLSNHFRRPVIVIAMNEEGIGRGSCRSIDDYDMVEGLERCSKYLEKWGGHSMAAGLELRQENLEPFKKAFNEVTADALKERDLRPIQRVDGWMELGDVNWEFFNMVEALGPFGASNPAPVWAAHNVRPQGRPRVVGNGHLRMAVVSENGQLAGIGFGLGDREVPSLFDIAFRLHRNEFRGVESLEMQVQDFKESDFV